MSDTADIVLRDMQGSGNNGDVPTRPSHSKTSQSSAQSGRQLYVNFVDFEKAYESNYTLRQSLGYFRTLWNPIQTGPPDQGIASTTTSDAQWDTTTPSSM